MRTTYPTLDDVAIVGLACRFAGAPDAAAYWRNIVSQIVSIGEHPHAATARLLDPAAARFDRLTTLRGGYLRDLAAGASTAPGVPAEALPGSNPDQFLTTQLAAEALQDAGFDARQAPSVRAGFFLGYAAPLNPASANWLQHGLVVDQTAALLLRLCPAATDAQREALRRELAASLPPVHPVALRGAFGFGVAGPCAAALGLTGPACALDAGCASAMAALRLAMDELRLGRCDVAVVGAVQSCVSPQVLMGLACLLGFTGRDRPYPLHREADGTLPGEGGAFLVLKRRPDAVQDRDRIYALVKSVGLAAGDVGHAAMRVLNPEPLVAAMRDAYAEGAADPDSIALLEAHGSGIPREDQMEIQALRQVFGDRATATATPRIVIGSVKGGIGHTFAAAGAAGLVKAVLALHHRVLPPMPACHGRLQPRLTHGNSPFFVATAPRPWVHGRQPPRRAAVNAFCIACAHAHVILEEHPDPS